MEADDVMRQAIAVEISNEISNEMASRNANLINMQDSMKSLLNEVDTLSDAITITTKTKRLETRKVTVSSDMSWDEEEYHKAQEVFLPKYEILYQYSNHSLCFDFN